MRPSWVWLLRRVSSSGSVLGSLLLLYTNIVLASPTPSQKTNSIPDRVSAVRQALHTIAQSRQGTPYIIASWVNWGDWANWNNWNNWNNWGNWGNWFNF